MIGLSCVRILGSARMGHQLRHNGMTFAFGSDIAMCDASDRRLLHDARARGA